MRKISIALLVFACLAACAQAQRGFPFPLMGFNNLPTGMNSGVFQRMPSPFFPFGRTTGRPSQRQTTTTTTTTTTEAPQEESEEYNEYEE
uniref:Putative salivary mucin n=1 Tax=Oncopeltus fasciatus TaxID=7536 RepID=A3FK37_ONCFA|nr:putative salivary mucin [Oncopeltus fasciatus]